ncbi:hypothetical protein JCM3766R1_007151 [Sporobolomyces carnicolor]
MSITAWTHSTPPFPSTLTRSRLDTPRVESLADDEVLIEVDAASLNPVDVQLANLAIWRLAAFNQTPRPLGKDFAGTVIARGARVDKFDVGTRVMGVSLNPLASASYGTLSQVAVVDTKRACVVEWPSHLSAAEACSLPLAFLTAVTTLSPPYLVLPPPRDDEEERPAIVVLGASSAVGIYAVQYARNVLGLDVVATASTRNVAFVSSTLGATTVVDYTRTDRLVDELLAARPRRGFVSIIDCVGGTELFDDDRRRRGTTTTTTTWRELLRPRDGQYKEGGSYTTIVGDKTARDRLGGHASNYWTPTQLWRSLTGWFGFSPRYHCVSLNLERPSWLEQVGPLVADGKLEVVVDSEYDFDQVPQAFAKLVTGKATGKIVVHVKDSKRR